MVLLSEENAISLRTAMVLEDKQMVSLFLAPPSESFATSGSQNYAKHDVVWLYRLKRSLWGELLVKLRRFSFDRNIKAENFAITPKLVFKWADSGNSVAVLLDGTPWAFIHEAKNHGYSKGVLRPAVGNLWDQALFEATFIKGVKP